MTGPDRSACASCPLTGDCEYPDNCMLRSDHDTLQAVSADMKAHLTSHTEINGALRRLIERAERAEELVGETNRMIQSAIRMFLRGLVIGGGTAAGGLLLTWLVRSVN